MVILVYPNVRNVVVSGQWENNCSNNVPGVLINTQIINIFSSWIRTTNFWKYGSISWDKLPLGQKVIGTVYIGTTIIDWDN